MRWAWLFKSKRQKALDRLDESQTHGLITAMEVANKETYDAIKKVPNTKENKKLKLKLELEVVDRANAVRKKNLNKAVFHSAVLHDLLLAYKDRIKELKKAFDIEDYLKKKIQGLGIEFESSYFSAKD